MLDGTNHNEVRSTIMFHNEDTKPNKPWSEEFHKLQTTGVQKLVIGEQEFWNIFWKNYGQIVCIFHIISPIQTFANRLGMINYPVVPFIMIRFYSKSKILDTLGNWMTPHFLPEKINSTSTYSQITDFSKEIPISLQDLHEIFSFFSISKPATHLQFSRKSSKLLRPEIKKAYLFPRVVQ